MSIIDPNNAELGAVANWLRLISHPSRLAIVLLLRDGPRAVSEIETMLNLRQPNLSQHLGVLRDSHMLAATRQAKSVVYELGDGPSLALIKAIETALQASQEAPADSPPSIVEPGRDAAAQRVDTRSGSAETDDAAMFAHVVIRRDNA
ncbi:metalloregulator ArsR/SmtB family transcription factor [Caballeronia sp. LZ034LL]|uniref:ArsR/SmtB family transcription factor n=1 Tax=Caballeronia sp. LZ034LL TaxID=3038567 RepID=UPI0028550407|nr:metalloregulator ArsR/SmtB family transcription factor [Caballeronia sp. LZ034LL]MDR5836072.1 metalloregulator ArsR/SmtB family transcription factor [Caballeronia sp. LZ034LL]